MSTGKWCCSLVIAAFALGGAATAVAQPRTISAEHAEDAAALEKLRSTRDALIAVTELDAALEVAERIVAAAGSGASTAISDDLLQLALIQTSLADYDAAERNCLRAIELLEHEQGVFSADLIAPYHALGRSYIEAQRFADAMYALERARALSQRDQGLFNLQQMELLDDMTRAHVESGDRAAARALQIERLESAIRHFGPDTPELIPFYRHLGDFYLRVPSSVNARDQYQKALEMSDAHYGDRSAESLDLLRRLTAVELRLNRRSEARDRLAAAVDSVEQPGAEQRGLALTVLGDSAVVDGDRATAERYYSAAYEALRESKEVDANELFATPAMLDFVPPRDGVDGSARFPLWSFGFIELAVDVSATGRASNVRTLAMEPRIDRLEREYRKHVRETLFRPALERGRPVAREGVSYRHRFRYYARD